MDYRDVAAKVLDNIGGANNVSLAMTCLTRLRLTLNDISLVKADTIRALSGVLGVVKRHANEIEIVFGPSSIEGISEAFAKESGIVLANAEEPAVTFPELELASADPEHDEPHAKAQAIQTALPEPVEFKISAGHRQSYRAQQRAAIDNGRLVKGYDQF